MVMLIPPCPLRFPWFPLITSVFGLSESDAGLVLSATPGACEGTLACSTCHLIFKQEDYDKLPSKPTDEELDMLDLAFGLEDT
ncbi:adrenodoxin, mitochondrial, partial [Elysia marginata]